MQLACDRSVHLDAGVGECAHFGITICADHDQRSTFIKVPFHNSSPTLPQNVSENQHSPVWGMGIQYQRG
jgi:hypothetical protein